MGMSGNRIVRLKDSDDLLENIEHHFKVIAGPGAGKTRWLCSHIKNVLNKSDRLKKSRKIACITYTNIGVETILTKIGESIDKVEVSTIHSFLYKNIVKPYIFLLKGDFEFDPSKIDGHDELTPSKGFVIEWLKRTNQFYKDYKGKLDQIIKVLCDIYWKILENDSEIELEFRHNWQKKIGNYSIKKSSLIEYKKMFWERSWLHHDDILYFSLELIRKYPDILRVIRCKFPYFFIDEFQDTNPIQTKIIKMVAEQETIVGVIGDKAQSIYGFQGANVKQFEEFEVPNLVTYKIENNYRSAEEILTVLNYIRKDIEQHNPSDKRGEKPIILMGPTIENYNRVKRNLDSNNICTLSYTNLTSCEMKNEYIGLGKEDFFIKLKVFDSTKKRGDKIASLIKGVEYARQNKFKDAIKEVSRYFKSEDIYKGKKISLILIKEMLDYYEEYCNGSLYDIYDSLNKKRLIELMKIPKINVSRKTMINEFYQKTKYKDIILCMKYYDDNSLHRTIHKAKGDEFDNVFVILPDKADWVSNEEEILSFLLNPDLNKEEHRVYYVALSRARKRLFVNIPKLSTTHQEKLKEIGFNIEKY